MCFLIFKYVLYIWVCSSGYSLARIFLQDISGCVELYRMVLHFCHILLRFPMSFGAMSLFEAGSSDRMKLFTECAMVSQILVFRLFAGGCPLSHEER